VIVQSGAGSTSTAAVAGGASGAVTIRSQAGGAKADTGIANGGAAGAVAITGGAGGATASDDGGSIGGAGATITLTAGAGGNGTGAASDGGNAGDVVLVPGAGGTTAGGLAGKPGAIIHRSTQNYFKCPTPTALADTAPTLTAAQMLSGIITGAPTTARSWTLPTGTEMDAGVSAAMAADDAFELNIINLSAGADDIITLVAGASFTIVGKLTIEATDALTNDSRGRFFIRKTAANTFVLYRVA